MDATKPRRSYVFCLICIYDECHTYECPKCSNFISTPKMSPKLLKREIVKDLSLRIPDMIPSDEVLFATQTAFLKIVFNEIVFMVVLMLRLSCHFSLRSSCIQNNYSHFERPKSCPAKSIFSRQ
jgi:hypothetical protein